MVSAWRSVEREMPIWRHSSRSAGSRAPGSSSPSLIAVPSRSSVSSYAVCERTGANSVAASTLRPSFTSRSNPRTRSQSVTAASKASSSIRALLR